MAEVSTEDKTISEKSILRLMNHCKAEIKKNSDEKVDKVTGKGLSTNDYTDTEKTKLSGIESGAEVNVIESISVNGSPQTITDKNVDITISGGSSDVNYSTTPKKVGKWFDGRDCYEVTLVKESSSNMGNTTIDITDLNIDEFFVVGGYAKYLSGNKYSLPFKDGNEGFYAKILNNDNNTLSLGGVGIKLILVLRYVHPNI